MTKIVSPATSPKLGTYQKRLPTWSVTSWSLSLGPFVPEKCPKPHKKVIIFIENWKENGS